MKVNQGGTTVTGKVTHAVFGEWAYDGTNVPWCSDSITLSGVETHVSSDVEVTCKRCLKVVPTFSKEQRNLAFEVTQLYRHGFTKGAIWFLTTRELLRGLEGTAKWPVIKVARIVLSGNKESSD